MANYANLKVLFIIIGFIGVIGFGLLGAFLGNKYKMNTNRKEASTILLVVEAILIVSEIFKQIFLALNGGFEWERFPFQICSLIVYIIPIISFVKNEKIKDALTGFLAFFCMTGGLFYFVKPAAALNTPYMLISLQSFIWHWLIIFTGVFVIFSYRLFEKSQLRIIVGPATLFIILSIIAGVVDYILFSVAPELNVNYFYISYGAKPFYPVLNLIFKEQHPYLLYFVCFLIYYIAGACIIYGISRAVHIIRLKLTKH